MATDMIREMAIPSTLPQTPQEAPREKAAPVL